MCNVNNGGCQHICEDGYNSGHYHCRCYEGYHLIGKGKCQCKY